MDDGARLRRRVRPARERLVRVDPAVRAVRRAVPRPRRPFRWLHLDLLVLLGFSVSLAFFNAARIGLSAPLVYPLLALPAGAHAARRCAAAAPREPLRLLVPVALAGGRARVPVGFRIGLNVTNSNVIDVGYSGVIGAHRLVHGQPAVRQNCPSNDAHGDTYGPVNYYAYVPVRAALPVERRWDDLPAAHAAAIAFDLLTIARPVPARPADPRPDARASCSRTRGPPTRSRSTPPQRTRTTRSSR